MGLSEKRNVYLQRQRKLTALSGSGALLARDQETHLPDDAADTRAEQLSVLSGIAYNLQTEDAYVDTVNFLNKHKEDLAPRQQRSVTLTKKELDQQLAVDEEFVTAFAKLKSKAQSTWRKAKQQDDFSLFAPLLEELISMSKERAQKVEPGADPYDVLLDTYEEGMNQEQYDALLLPLREPIVKLVDQLPSRKRDETYRVPVGDRGRFEEFLHDLAASVGFDFDKGTIGAVTHPFATRIGPNDERINYHEGKIVGSTWALIHELGHGLYDMHTDPQYDWMNLSGGVSLGVHESQSRLLENIIGKSKAGVSFVLNLLQKHLPVTKNRTVDGLYAYINHVHPSLIRVDADEVTYNLHVLLRYEIEKELITGNLSVEQVPAVWNQKMDDYLGITPESDAQGCLQDVHWSMGYFGYFPTYMLGNLIGAQLWERYQAEHPDWDKDVVDGNFKTYIHWFQEHIWQHGHRYEPGDLVEQATGSALSPTYFLDYLHKKYR